MGYCLVEVPLLKQNLTEHVLGVGTLRVESHGLFKGSTSRR